MPQIVWITDANGVTNYYNRRWYEFTGLDYNTPEYDITPFLHPDDISHSERAWQHAIKTGKPYQIEYRFKDFKREDYRWFLGRAVPVRDEKGKITKWYGTSTDIDAIKRTIRRKNELEDLATMLEEERRELLALNDAKDEFISLASHQLRTPATGVKQYIGMLLQGFFGEISPEHQEILQRAYDSNERQLRTVNDMLLVARVDANKIKLNKQLTDISELVKEAADEQRGEFEKRNQDLTVKVPKSLPASVDGAYLRMVIDNLLENASKYTYENGAIKVTLKEEKGEIVLAVKDSGVGISPKDQEKLFQKFSRIDNPLSVAAEGSGLGLYWSQKIIDMHRGTLTVSSRPNDGTTFTMRIPKKKAR
jgi:PAS domain S-box-containing protein